MVESPTVATGAAVLGRYELCRDARFDAFRDSLNGVFYPARVVPTGRETGGARSRLAAAQLTHLTLGFVRFGTETSLDPGVLGYYHVNVPFSGVVESACGDRTIVARPGLAAVFTPHEHTVLPRWGRTRASSASRSSVVRWRGSSRRCWAGRSSVRYGSDSAST